MKQSMINLFVLISFLCMGLDAFAQGRVNFEPLTFKEALEKAQERKETSVFRCLHVLVYIL